MGAESVLRFGVTALGADGNRSGIGQYAMHLLSALSGIDGGRGAEVMTHASEAPFFAPGKLGLRRFELSDRLRAPLLSVAWHQAALAGWCRRRAWDVLFLPAANRRLPVRVPCPSVGTVHDFSMLHVRGKYDRLRGVYIERVLPALVRRLTRVITVSESSKRDIVEHARVSEERVHVIPHGVDTERFQPCDWRRGERPAARHGVRGPYVLYVSRIEHPGKNHVRLIRAFRAMKRDRGLPHQLLLAGSDWSGAAAVHEVAREGGTPGDVVFAGFVPDEEIVDLYRSADMLVFPSLYEGFGMPILEAMACGTPVACSNTSSLPEVAGDAAVTFDPEDESAIALAMTVILEHPDFTRQLTERGLARARRFTWSRAAEETLAVLHLAAAEGRR
jgi:glycosyltransferase involved in cell wall biosynthesis